MADTGEADPARMPGMASSMGRSPPSREVSEALRACALLLEVNTGESFVILRQVPACTVLPLLTALLKIRKLSGAGYVRDYFQDFGEVQ